MNKPALAALVLGFVSAVPSAPSSAAPCAGLADVEDTSLFCPSVEWMKNRAITTGCGDGTVYCPNEAVSRLAMAAFMKRLGTAMTPFEMHTSVTLETPLDIDAAGPGGAPGPLLCISDPFAIAATGYPRYASVDGTFAARFNASAESCVNLFYTDDAGAHWNPINDCDVVLGAPTPGIAAAASAIGKRVQLDVGKTYSFALGVDRVDGATTGDPTVSTCALRVNIYNRNGVVSPLDRL